MGYIGLPTAAVIASRGLMVAGVDVAPSVVETINAGGIHIVEPDLSFIESAARSVAPWRRFRIDSRSWPRQISWRLLPPRKPSRPIMFSSWTGWP